MLTLIPPDKLEHLGKLHQRGNLSTEEYHDCKLRLETGETRQKVVKSSLGFSDVLAALGRDLNYLISDPEVIRRKKLLAHEQSQSSFSLQPRRASSSENDHPSVSHSPWNSSFAAGAETATSNAGHVPKPKTD